MHHGRVPTRVLDRPPTDTHVPVVTLVPQLAATLVVAGDPVTTQLAFLLAVGLDLPLRLVASRTRRDPSLVLPGVALGWAALCHHVPEVLGAWAAPAATAAVVSSLVVAALLFVLPGPWSSDGAVRDLACRAGLSTRRFTRAHVARRVVLLGCGAGGLLLLTAPWLAALVGAGVLVALPLDVPDEES